MLSKLYSEDLYNGGIFSGHQSLLALYLSGTPSLKTSTRPPSCIYLNTHLYKSLDSHMKILRGCMILFKLIFATKNLIQLIKFDFLVGYLKFIGIKLNSQEEAGL